MSEASNGSNLPLRGLRGIRNLRARRQVAPNLTPAELAYRRREQERRQEREVDAYIDSADRTPEELEQRRLDRLQRKLYRDSEDVSELTSPQRAARDLEIARNEVNEVYNSPEALALDARNPADRRRLGELVEEARLRRLVAAQKSGNIELMNTRNNAVNPPLQIQAMYDSPPDRRRWWYWRVLKGALPTAPPQLTPGQIAAAARKELGVPRIRGERFFGGSTKRRKTRGRKSRGTRRRR